MPTIAPLIPTDTTPCESCEQRTATARVLYSDTAFRVCDLCLPALPSAPALPVALPQRHAGAITS